MLLAELKFEYPEELVAQKPERPTRVMWWAQGRSEELNLTQTLARISAGDVLVINNTKVLKRRIFAGDLEILFLSSADGKTWDVLFPAKKLSLGDTIDLPEGKKIKLIQKGRPQVVESESVLDENYFARVAELPLPPYIQKARGARHALEQDEKWYQSAWAATPGSFAAPTASLHFTSADIQSLKNRGVKVLEVTLHVGLGTFLPVAVEDLDQHVMHDEFYEVADSVWSEIIQAKKSKHKVWALGTTVARTLESCDRLGRKGFTKILLQRDADFQIVDRLLTNFHQPESTLLALVAGFVGLENVRKAYSWAIERKFRLFSYGDLSVWLRD